MATVKVWFFFRVYLQLLKLQITTATLIASFKISAVRIIFIASFHSRVKMNSTNWPTTNVWVFIAQLPKAEAIGSNPVEVSKFFFFRFNLKLFKLQLPLHATIILSFKVCWILSWQNWKKVYGPLRKPFQLLNVSLYVHYSLLYKLKVLWSMLRMLVPVQAMKLLNTH